MMRLSSLLASSYCGRRLMMRPCSHNSSSHPAALLCARRMALTSQQVTMLDHSLRQVLIVSNGSCLVTNVTRKMPDAAIDLLDDLDGSLVQYLQRNPKFLVRSHPDGRKVVSLSAKEVITTLSGQLKKVLTAVYELLEANPVAHLQGMQGMRVSHVMDKLSSSHKRTVGSMSGGLAEFLLPYSNIVELSSDKQFVRCVDEKTPLQPHEGLQSSSGKITKQQSPLAFVAASSPPLTGDADLPLSPYHPTQRVTIIPEAPRRGQLASTSSVSAEATMQNVWVTTLASMLPFDCFVPLSNLIQNDATRQSLLATVASTTTSEHHPCNDSETSDSNYKHQQLAEHIVQVLETSGMASNVDCRVFSPSGQPLDASSVYVRMLGADPRSATPRPAEELGDGRFELPYNGARYAWSLVQRVAQQYRRSLPPQEIGTWMSVVLAAPETAAWEADEGPPLGGEQRHRPMTQAAGDVEHLPSMSIDDLVELLCNRALMDAEGVAAGAAGDDIGIFLTQAKQSEGIKEVRLFIMLMFDRLPHLFDVNWQTFEVRIRREIFAAWCLLQPTQQPSTSSQSTTTTAVSSSSSITLASVLDTACTHPALKGMIKQMDMLTTPTPAALRTLNVVLTQPSEEEVSAGRGAGGGWAPLATVQEFEEGSYLPPREMESIHNVFGSVERFVSYHAWFVLLRDAQGDPLPMSMATASRSARDTIANHVDEHEIHQGEDDIHTTMSTVTDETTTSVVGYLWSPSRLAAYKVNHRNNMMNSTNMSSYSGRDWSDNVIAQAFYDTLPADGETSVVWKVHHNKLQKEYRDVLPVAVLHRLYARSFFVDRPELFSVFDMIHNDTGSFVVGRKGVSHPPFGVHPRTCKSLEDAIRQLAMISVGGKSLTVATTCLSPDARVWFKRFGGVESVALQLPFWFQLQSQFITYIGADNNTEEH